jgi:hypothetical protein
MPFVGDRWALLRIRFDGPYLVVRFLDSEGRDQRFYDEWIHGAGWRLGACLPPIVERLQALAGPLPLSRPAPHSTGPVPLAVFVQTSRALQRSEAWSRIVAEVEAAMPPPLGPNRITLVSFAGRMRRRRPAFALPFNIVAHGVHAQADVEALRREPWLRDEAVRQWGCSIATADDTEPLEGVLRATDVDVLVSDALEALTICAQLPLRRRPRLIVLNHGFHDQTPPAPAGVAVAWFPQHSAFLPPVPPPAGMLSRPPDLRIGHLLFGLVHDLPLHEAMKAAERSRPLHPLPDMRPRLFADPWTNQSLRIRDALVRLQTDMERFELTLPRGDLRSFWQRIARTDPDSERVVTMLRTRLKPRAAPRVLRSPGGDDFFARAGSAYSRLKSIHDTVADERRLPEDFEAFSEEGEGLVPMARSRESLAKLRDEASLQVSLLEGAAADPDFQAVLDRHQQRTVDLAMQRLETSPLLQPLNAATTLAAGAAYRVRVHIGNPQPDSLVSGERAPIDPLLPQATDEGHMLEVAVQAKRFTLESPRTRPLRLPRFGASRPVYFSVRAPRELGAASLRVHVYYQNHLVQSYLLSAWVDDDEREMSDQTRRLEVVLAYTRVVNLARVEVAGARALSIGANADGGTHKLIIKSSGSSGELTLAPQTFASDVRKFRKLLADAARDPDNRKRGRVYPVLEAGEAPSPQVADNLRAFARQGSDLYEAFFRRASRNNEKLRAELIQLPLARDTKIQVVRFDDNFVFPWTLLYDYLLPDWNLGDPEPEVCLGHTLNADGEPVPCGHTAAPPVICMNGFWSVRHLLEEVIGRGVDADDTVARPAAAAVRVLCDAGLPGAARFETRLGEKIEAPHLALGPASEKPLLDLLWRKPPARPSILVIVGHMETRSKQGEADSPRITLVRATEWLTRKRIGNRATRALRWDQPRPIVLLMACDSAGTTMTTVNNFEMSLLDAGAAAIVGAEAVVPSSLAMRCAEEMSQRLWVRQPLGAEMTRFRRRVLAMGNPLAFVFHALGNIDLTVA